MKHDYIPKKLIYKKSITPITPGRVERQLWNFSWEKLVPQDDLARVGSNFADRRVTDVAQQAGEPAQDNPVQVLPGKKYTEQLRWRQFRRGESS